MTKLTDIFKITFLLLAFSSSNLMAKEELQSFYYQEFDDENEFTFYEEKHSEEIYDPLEKYNRKIYAFNDFVDRYCLQYVAMAYRDGVPKGVRGSIRNFLNNLYSPISTVNSLLQGKSDNAMASFSNFLINSTIGVFGLFDVAQNKSIFYKKEDFGQTLGYYKVRSGPYLVIPILGPSSARDLGGMAVDKTTHPMDFNLLKFGGKVNAIDYRFRLASATISGIDKRESLIEIIDDVRKDSFDPYATIRSAYLQKRAAEIEN